MPGPLSALAFTSGVMFHVIVGSPAPLSAATGLAAGAYAFIIFTPATRLAELSRRYYASAPFCFGVVGAFYFWWYASAAPLEVSGAVFEVTAQIIPVLILTAIVDVRRANRIATEEVLFTLGILIQGEVMAILGIMTQSAIRFGLVCGALTTGFTALTLSVLAEGEGAGQSSATDANLDDDG